MSVERGTLHRASDAPASGEKAVTLSSGDRWRVEQILSGQLAASVDDLLDHDEWVVILEGRAELEVEGEVESLERGDWVRLVPGVAHRVLSAEPGTSWLALHVGTDAPPPAS